MAKSSDSPPNRPWIVFYDGQCGLCKWLLAGLLFLDREKSLRPMTLQSKQADPLLGDLEASERSASWHLVSPSGVRTSAGSALPPFLTLLSGGRLPAAVLARFPGLTESAYRWVAGHRIQLSRFVPEQMKRQAAQYLHERERP